VVTSTGANSTVTGGVVSSAGGSNEHRRLQRSTLRVPPGRGLLPVAARTGAGHQ
jgi:hypothetical protein